MSCNRFSSIIRQSRSQLSKLLANENPTPLALMRQSSSKAITRKEIQNDEISNHFQVRATSGRLEVEDAQTIIRYVRIGNGPHTVVFMPGAIGSWETDWRPQMFSQNSLFVKKMKEGKFTLIGIDPSGYGHSRPPSRLNPLNFEDCDAHEVASALEMIGVDRFSIVTWSSGTLAAGMLASHYPKRVRRMVLHGACCYASHYSMRCLEAEREPSTWADGGWQVYEKFYGKNVYTALWTQYVNATQRTYWERPVREHGCGDRLGPGIGGGPETVRYDDFQWTGEYWRARIPLVQSPTLIFFGTTDLLTAKMQLDPFRRLGKNFRIIEIQNGKHHLHLNGRTMLFYNENAVNFLLEDKD